MGKIDLTFAKNSFRRYLEDYDQKDPKIHLKKVHTFCVVEAADYICTQEKINQEDHELALLIALLHDIGRFEQLRQFNSYDDNRFDHASFGVQVLFQEGRIQEFIKTREFDQIIRQAIAWHSAYELPDMEEERILLHCRIIRDADKLDNFRVKATESLEAHFDVSKEVVEREQVSPQVLDAVRNHRCLLRGERKTHLDMWISYLAFIFDLNFSSSFRYILEHDYINNNIDRMVYREEKAARAMEEIRSICMEYLQAGCKTKNCQ